ncbi:receptor-type tyrosine-protein phosphatase epsilon-like [Mytilus trossulus]|uniref:receptor-type tyrosine-protein phosphatase epsilon-like n=1 Tax=Mytilus trossulus TaxID=6551 RepID=UPI0030044B88
MMSLKLILLIIIIETVIVTVSAQINLVPQGKSEQSTDYRNFSAKLAIIRPANNEWDDGCSATDTGQTYAWWGLQLPTVAHMTHIVIYYRKETPERMDGFRLYLENGTADQRSDLGLCYTDQGKGYPDVTQNISCNMLAKNMFFVNNRNNGDCFVELCYVEIYGCLKGTWGRNCTELCPLNCINQNCYPETGVCVWGCDAHNCLNDKCDNKTGSCTDGCVIGQVGQYCDMQCDNGFYGLNCTEQCATCFNMSCERLDGNCTFGCIDKYEGVRCETLEECDDGFYGLNCTERCATCFNMSCERLDGNCTYGCTDRYEGDRCEILVNGELNTRDNNSSASIVGGIGTAVVVIIVVFAILIIIYRRRSKPSREKYIRNQDKINRSDENMYCNHNFTLKTEDVFLNVDSVQDLAKDKPPLTGKQKGKTSVIEVMDEYPEEHDEEDGGNIYNNIPSEQAITQYKIHIGDLKMVINEKRKEDGFKKEYELLPKGLVYAHVEGSKEENKVKNRFLTTWPYDHSRVVLTRDNKHDYINASYIDSYNKEKAYIATQGPKKNTLRDFWQMVWQENVCKIVMVTKLVEGRRKCEQYWPESVDRATVVDNFRLTMTKEKCYTVFVYRSIIVNNKKNKQERIVHHFHFTEWPDHGVPDSVKLVSFYRKVKAEKCDVIGPMLVHCSAGVGRTGTFIAVDAIYKNSRKVGFVDIMEYVLMMRKDRMNMIQTHEQYEIVFEALLELLTVPDTSIQKDNFSGYLLKQDNKTLPKNQTMYSEEFQRLRTLRPSYSADNFTAANCKKNKTKNSSIGVLAHDNYRPYLMSYGRTRSDYINAVIIPGYSVDSKMFVTQCPLVETVIDFWTMMYDHSSRIIVLLDPENKGAPLWLEKKEMLQFDDFRIIKEKENAQEELQLTMHHTKHQEKISMKVFTANDWNISNAPPSPEYMLDLLQRVQTYWETQKVPITVVCSDGCSKSGLFVALKLILEKMQIDDEIDIFQVVRELQMRQPEFLVDFDQYEYCYKCIRALLDGDSLYANI